MVSSSCRIPASCTNGTGKHAITFLYHRRILKTRPSGATVDALSPNHCLGHKHEDSWQSPPKLFFRIRLVNYPNRQHAGVLGGCEHRTVTFETVFLLILGFQLHPVSFFLSVPVVAELIKPAAVSVTLVEAPKPSLPLLGYSSSTSASY